MFYKTGRYNEGKKGQCISVIIGKLIYFSLAIIPKMRLLKLIEVRINDLLIRNGILSSSVNFVSYFQFSPVLNVLVSFFNHI